MLHAERVLTMSNSAVERCKRPMAADRQSLTAIDPMSCYLPFVRGDDIELWQTVLKRGRDEAEEKHHLNRLG